MNYSIVRYTICRVLEFQGIFLVLPCLVSVIYREKSGWAYFVVMLACFIVGWVGKRKKPVSTVFFAREGFVTVTLSWIVLSLTGSAPYFLSGEISCYTDALFETVSGLTTTSATILDDIGSLSYCSLFWRSFTNWVGGMGVLVLMLAVLPLAGGYNMHLMRAESPGPSVGKIVPRVRQTARILYEIYILMTIMLILFLLCSGVNFFESVTLAFSTAGTGGFTVLNSSVASYSGETQVIIAFFLILFGANFNIFYLFFSQRAEEVLKHEEVKFYFLIIAVATALITWNIRADFGSFPAALHQAVFQVASFITTTGFVTADFGQWPAFSQSVLLMLMFIGACSASTGGGIKISRIIILLKLVKSEISHLVHPKRVKHIRMDSHVIPKERWRSILVFLIAYLLIFGISLMAISLCELDFTTNFTAVAATLNNVGIGLNQIGPASNFRIFSDPAKWVLMFDMLAGRLEIFPMLVFLAPSTWKRG